MISVVRDVGGHMKGDCYEPGSSEKAVKPEFFLERSTPPPQSNSIDWIEILGQNNVGFAC